MKTAVDTNVLLDLLTDDPEFGERSREFLRRALQAGTVVICEVVYSELAAAFKGNREKLDEFLSELGIQFEASDREALVLAGSLWRAQGRKSHAGRVLPDFVVGAHAKLHADRLLSRDRGFYRGVFSGLKVVDPE